MNLIKLAQLVQDLEDQGFEQEATNLADAITEDTESAEEIINSPETISSLDKIVGDILDDLAQHNKLDFRDNNISNETLNILKNSLNNIVKYS
jgi:hypothetical protein